MYTNSKPTISTRTLSNYFHDTAPPSTSPVCHLIISTIAAGYSLIFIKLFQFKKQKSAI